MRSNNMLQHVSQSVLTSDDDRLHVADVAYVSHDKSVGLPIAVITSPVISRRRQKRCQQFVIELD